MKDVAQLLNDMMRAGVITDYALFGATAQMRYTEPIVTLDAGVQVNVPHTGNLDILHGVYEFCAARGLRPEGPAIRVGSWPVQFIPAFSPLTQEALREAEETDFEGVPFRVVGADYLAVIALSVGRPKDLARVVSLLDSGSVSRDRIRILAERHGLTEAWTRYTSRFPDDG